MFLIIYYRVSEIQMCNWFDILSDFLQQNQEEDSKPYHFNLEERKDLKLIQIFRQLSNDSRNQKSSASIMEQIRKMNFEQKIQNEELFGPATNKTLVIVVQVHNRLTYLRHLIHSFSQVCTFPNLTNLILQHL
jgi:hypothetical protein